MIVKNEAENLKQTLPNIVKHAAEVIVVDTGSTDNTVEVAKGLGAKVHHFTWINDFAAARNYSISLATQPWILWLDADEYLKEEDLKKAIDHLKNSSEDVLAHGVILTEAPYGKTIRGISYSRIKLFRNFAGIHFVRPINEQLLDREGKSICGKATSVIIYHWGKDLSQEKMQGKKERYFALYHEFLTKNPSDPYVNFLLGNLLREEKRLQEAYIAYESAVENSGKDLKLKIDALTSMAEIALKLNKYKESFQAANQVVSLDPENSGARNIMATLLIGIGKEDTAIQILEEALKSLNCQTIDPIREQVIPRIVLAKAYLKKDNLERARFFEKEAKDLEDKINANSTR
ncbi:MAG: glycosyltransferase [Candidatus Margulisbacteria bacterium]|nr:glycosyltransferase [Candidatus Margulisiibacteriota bacterium]